MYGANFVAIEPAACKIGTIGPLAREGQRRHRAERDDQPRVRRSRGGHRDLPRLRPAFEPPGYVGGDSSSARYEYENAKHVTAVVPSGGGAGGVTRGLALYGPTIREGSDVDCVVGNVRVAGAATSAGTVSCEDLWVGAFRGFVSVGVNGLRAESHDVVFGV